MLLAVVLIAIATVMAEAVRVAEENEGLSERGDDMPILVNLDVMLAGARCARASWPSASASPSRTSRC